MPNQHGEPLRSELRDSETPVAAVEAYAQLLGKHHGDDVRAFGLTRTADDLVARSIITTRQELAAFEAIFEAPALREFTVAGCVMRIESDSDKGGWRLRCRRHGRIATRATIGDAELVGNRHAGTFERIDAIRRTREIQAKVGDYFAAETAAVSLTIEHGGLFFAVDRELTVSQPFATQAAAEAQASRMGEELAAESHVFHGGAAGSFASEGCVECQ